MEHITPTQIISKILVVDDDRDELLLLSDKLKEQGYEVQATNNGVEALRIISQQKIDLIICDIRMPLLSGFTLVKMLKNFYFNNIPVILMSAGTHDVSLFDNHGVEIKNFFSKPIDFTKLFNRVTELIPAGVVTNM